MICVKCLRDAAFPTGRGETPTADRLDAENRVDHLVGPGRGTLADAVTIVNGDAVCGFHTVAAWYPGDPR